MLVGPAHEALESSIACRLVRLYLAWAGRLLHVLILTPSRQMITVPQRGIRKGGSDPKTIKSHSTVLLFRIPLFRSPFWGTASLDSDPRDRRWRGEIRTPAPADIIMMIIMIIVIIITIIIITITSTNDHSNNDNNNNNNNNNNNDSLVVVASAGGLLVQSGPPDLRGSEARPEL